MKNAVIPGLFDDHLEMIAIGEDLKVVFRGLAIPFENLPEAILAKIRAELNKDIKARMALKEWGFSEGAAMLKQFAWCRFGGVDLNPDLCSSGKLTPDYHECGNRGNCPFEGKICVNTFNLTRREEEVLKLIALGYPEKLIAADLFIAQVTVAKVRKSLFVKTKSISSVDLTRFALEHNFISPGDATH
tara:strand:+ start:8782 stop:9345 length:564 start_codon:yes stop_codon:yes gene_type:complete